MQNIQGYQLTETIARSDNTTVYRGNRKTDGLPVVVKTFSMSYPPRKDLARLKLEYDLVKSLDHHGIAGAVDLVKVDKKLAFVMEDFGAVSLGEWARAQRPGIARCLEIAVQLCDILNAVHLSDIIHKDIKPSNIVINPNNGKLGIIDFSIASRLSREKQGMVGINYLEGSLPYISPEQTGRMNRHIDYRSDLYSLGVSLYELITGRLPFIEKEALSMVHCHLAETPPSAHEVKDDVPEMVSAVLNKLMAKTVERRYQSAVGLRADLEECLARLRRESRIDFFETARFDMPLKLQVSQRLYGRESEIAKLMHAFQQVADGSTEMMLVAGYSGVGKSALIGEVHRPMVERRGFFLTSKFDQYRRNIPFQAISEAFQGLIRHILSEPREQIERWKEDMLAALENRGRVLTDLIPELELILGPQPAVTVLEGEESKRRLIDVFQSFLGVFTARGYPLIFFLDDLQWADQASLDLLQSRMTVDEGESLLVLGAYRDNEVDPSHPLMLTLDKIAKKKTFETIELAPLDLANTNQLVADTLYHEPPKTRNLATLLHAKTGGNPFFLGQFLNTLYAEKLVYFDPKLKQWTWSMDDIASMEASSNVVELMTARINKLTEETRELLRLASCLGNTFDLKTLAVISDREPRAAADGLWDAVVEGLVVPQSDDYRFYRNTGKDAYLPDPGKVVYKFLHDRIHEAAYSLMSEDDAREIHLRIGRLLLENVSGEERDEHIFDLVNHFNMGAALITDREEADLVAALNLKAGKKARSSTAHLAALNYLRQGTELLGETEAAWKRQYRTMFELSRNRTECEYLCEHMDKAEEVFADTLAHAANRQDKADIYELMMGAYMKFGRFTEGVKFGKACLELFGIGLPAIDDPDGIQRELEQEYKNIEVLIEGRDIEGISDEPDAEDSDLSIVMSMLHQTWNNSYFAEGLYDLGTLAALKIATISLQSGMTNYSSFGFVTYGLNLCGKGQYKAGDDFGRVGIRLQERFDNIYLVAKINNLFAHFISHYRRHFRNNIGHYEKSYRACLQTGDLWYGVWAVNYIPHIRFMMGDPLDEVYAEGLKYTPYARGSGVDMMWELLNLDQHIILNLQGKLDNPNRLSFDDDTFNEEKVIELLKGVPFDFGLFWVHCYKSFVYFLYGAYKEALELSMSADKNKNTAPGLMLSVDQHFYNSLIIAANWPDFNEEERKTYGDKLAENLELMKVWSESGPDNYLHKYQVMLAEQARLEGRYDDALDNYDAAIDSAREFGFMQNEAVINELAARCFLERGRRRAARGYISEAHYLYSRWGARVKVQDMEAKYGDLIIQGSHMKHLSDTTVTGVTSISDRLDLDVVMQAFQTISSQIVLGSLLKEVMRLVILNAGATRGALMLEDQGEWFVKARGTKDDIEFIEDSSAPLEGAVDLSLSIVHFVAKTREDVVLSNALEEPLFRSDTYIARVNPKSVLCTPISHQGKLSAILYLENNVNVGAFTEHRVNLMQLLCGQAAPSLENARLYASLEEYSQTLEQKVDERTRELSVKNRHIVSSIQYAQRIQTAILPELASIKDVFKECFVLFRPKDIVSGDFFWFSQRKDATFVTAVDCTGHGVPGAFMSLIGNTLLNRIINENNVYEPSVILRDLHEGVRAALRQEMGSGTTDGMDMSLCRIEAGKRRITFAGARCPLYLFRCNQNEDLEIIKGDRKSIGGRQKEERRQFTDHVLDYKAGDCIYLSTDGFTDQPGPAGEKYGPKRFRNFLASIAGQDIADQEKALIKEWTHHLGYGAQRDDVTVIGVRLS
ncbi:MAG: AAA family ATPase [Acidobacteriota bacterium]|nr:AAA family ATPase [Acidobacteriota bacterium]